MSTTRLPQFLFGLVLLALVPLNAAHAQLFESWVSGAGDDAHPCTRASPCASFAHAMGQTAAGGQISVMDAGNFGSVIINKSLTIANDTSGTATIAFAPFCIGNCAPGVGYIQISAGPNDVVSLRGLTVNNTPGFSNAYGLYITNAGRVNIEKCTFRNMTSSGIFLGPNASSDLKIEDTVVTGSAAGLRITSVPGVTVNADISRSSFTNNAGGGIKIDGSGGGPITAAISDSTISLNASNGINAVGSSANVMVNLLRDVIASNGLTGVQANGATAAVLVNSTSLLNNASAFSSVNSGRILTYGNNTIVGPPGSGFTGSAGLQ